MSNNDWTNKLRDRLADYQEPVSHDLWASIEQSLAQETPASTSYLISIRRWSVAAAVAALLAVGGGYVYYSQENMLPKQAGLVTSNNGRPATQSLLSLKPMGNEPEVAQITSEKIEKKSSLEKTKKKSSLMAMASTCQGMGDALIAEGQSESMAVSEEGTSDVPAVEKNKRTATNYVPATASSVVIRDKRKAKVGCDVTLFAENGVITSNAYSASSPYMMASAPDPYPNAFNDESVMPFVAVQKMANRIVAKHHAPVAVGIQVGIRVAPRLSLTTGAVYAYTSSDISYDGGNTYDTKQSLHYVGIPLGVNYEVWGTQRLHTYVMAGAEVDFNVKNHTEVDGVKVEEGVSKDRAQFSTKASLGIQYDVLPQVGVYLEPGAKYYFDNGSKIENTFKDKKLNFNLQFGLRWNIGK